MRSKSKQMIVDLSDICKLKTTEINLTDKPPQGISDGAKLRFLLTQIFAQDNFWHGMGLSDSEKFDKLKFECLRGEGKDAFGSIEKYKKQRGDVDQEQERYINQLCEALGKMGVKGRKNQLAVLYAFTQNVGNCAFTAGGSINFLNFITPQGDMISAADNYKVTVRRDNDLIFFDIKLSLSFVMEPGRDVGTINFTVAFDKTKSSIEPSITSMQYVITDPEVQQYIRDTFGDDPYIYIDEGATNHVSVGCFSYAEPELAKENDEDKNADLYAQWENLVTESEDELALDMMSIYAIIPNDDARSKKAFEKLDKSFSLKALEKFKLTAKVMTKENLPIVLSLDKKSRQNALLDSVGSDIVVQISCANTFSDASGAQQFGLVFQVEGEEGVAAYVSCNKQSLKIITLTKDAMISDTAARLSKRVFQSLHSASASKYSPELFTKLITLAPEDVPQREHRQSRKTRLQLVTRTEMLEKLNESISILNRRIKEQQFPILQEALIQDKSRLSSMLTIFKKGGAITLTRRHGEVDYACEADADAEAEVKVKLKAGNKKK